MKKFFAKAKEVHSSLRETQSAFFPTNQLPPNQGSSSFPVQQPSVNPPTPLDVIRYRYHHGVNLGSIFVLEGWLFPSMTPKDCPGGSELDHVRKNIELDGLEATKSKWEQHWSNAVSDQDFGWLVSTAGCTSIRLPIGYFTLPKRFSRGTPFEPVTAVYEGAWAAVRLFVARAKSYGIGVLLDLHALPGGANGDSHAGTGSGKAEFWGDNNNLNLATDCVLFIANEIRNQGLDGIIGLQLCNEAVWDANGMYEWYDAVIQGLRPIDDSLPIYISDAWDLDRALRWTGDRKGSRTPVVVDTHIYYTFSENDTRQTPAEIIAKISGELSKLDGKEGDVLGRGEAQVIVGEYSCVLSEESWGRVPGDERQGLEQEFGRTQSQKWQQRAGGSYFWTYKMDWMDGGGWGFVEQVKKENITPPAEHLLSPSEVQERVEVAHEKREKLHANARWSHDDYWNKISPQTRLSGRYSDGWNLGYSDADVFYTMRMRGGFGEKAIKGADRIGCLEIWIKKRLFEGFQNGEGAWEWEHGFRAGIKAFNDCVGI